MMSRLHQWSDFWDVRRADLTRSMKRWAKRVNALPHRDRVALLAGGVALLIGLELQVVMPVHDKRAALDLSNQPGTTDPLQQQSDAQALQAKQAELLKLQDELAKRPAVVAASVQGGTPRTVFAALRKTLALQEVEVVALKALPDGDPVKPGAHDASSDAQPPIDAVAQAAPVAEAASDALALAGAVQQAAPNGATPAAAPASSASASGVYRHRAELVVVGPLAQVSRVLKDFEQGRLPMHIERIKVEASPTQAAHVQATVSLVLISQEKSWLAM